MDEVYAINQFAIEGHMPDKTIFLNIDAETGLARINANRSYLDRLDRESVAFHNRVHEGYQKVIQKYEDRMLILDASKDVYTVIEDAYKALKELLDA